MEKFDFITISDGAVNVEGVGMVSASSICVRDSFAIMTEQQADEAFRRAVLIAPYTPLPDGMKWCYRCGETKMLDEFPVDQRRDDGHDSRCNACEAERKHNSRATQAEREGRRLRAWVRRGESAG